MKEFEEDLVSLISKITFRDVNDPFLKNVEEDLMKVNSSKDIFVFVLTKQQTFMKHHQKTKKSS